MAKLIWNGAVYLCGLMVFGVPPLQSAIVTAIVSIAAYIKYGQRWIYGIGIVIMVLALGTWVGFLPPSDQWSRWLGRMPDAVNSFFSISPT